MLSTLDASALVVLAVDGSLSRSQLAVGRGVGDMALVVGHVHVRLTATIGNPEPGAVAATGRAGREVLGNVIGSHTLPGSTALVSHGYTDLVSAGHLLLKDGEDNEVLHGDLAQVGLVRDSPGRTSSSGLVVGVHSTVILDAVRRVTRTAPILGVVVAIGPLASVGTVVGQGGLGLVVCKLDGELATGGKSYRSTILGRIVEASTLALHPPVVLGQLVEGVDRVVGVGVVVVGVRATLWRS